MAATIAVLSQKGGTGKTTTVRTLTRRLPPRRASTCWPSTSTRRATCPTTSTSIPTPSRRSATCSPAAPRPPTRSTTASSPPTSAGRGRAQLGGKMGRELTLRKALAGVARRLRHRPHRLPARARPAHRQRARGRHHALLSAEAQYFAMQGVEQALEVIELARESLNPDLEWLGVLLNIADMRTVHSREAYANLSEHFGQGLPHAGPGLDRLRGVGRAGGVDPRLPPRPRRGLPGARRRGARAAEAPRRPRAPAADARR